MILVLDVDELLLKRAIAQAKPLKFNSPDDVQVAHNVSDDDLAAGLDGLQWFNFKVDETKSRLS